MEKRQRSPAASSADEILSSATTLAATKPGKSSLRSLIFSLPPSSDVVASLPETLHLAVSASLDAFRNSLGPCGSPVRAFRSPPLKRSRPSSAAQKPDEEAEGSAAPISDETLDQLKNLKAYTFVAFLCFSHPKKLFSPSDLLPSVRSLHDCLVLYEMDSALLSQVAGLCEEWWKLKLPGRENLVSQSLPFLLSRSLTDCKKADVRRVYSLRGAFLLFDYVDESIEDLKMLLMRCVTSPVYQKMDEGRKFVSFVLGLNQQLTKEALELLKSQIPFGKKSMLEAFADILFRAWKGSEGSLREEIEDGFLQGLIEGAIYAGSKFLAASARRVLGEFVQQRMTDGVDKLLLRLVEPVLFRSLQVANSNVRQNALHLLLDMFPLEDRDMTKEVKESLQQKQFLLLEKLLLDDCPEVRLVAVEGSCRILHLFWEVIPTSTITKFLAKIVDTMSHNISNEVRISTINGIIYLLDNPQSHEIMKVLLPKLGFLFFDPVLSVRVSVVDLLLAVRDVHTFQFNKVVALDDLLSSLANDHPRVAQKITNLLIPCYFPSKLTIKEACSRFVALIKRSPDAGARFCEFAFSEGSSSRSLMELAKFCISLALSRKGLDREKTDGLLISSSNICQGLANESSVKPVLTELLSAERLKHMLTAASSERAQTAILSMASLVSSENVVFLKDYCLAILRNSNFLSDNVEKQEVVKAAQKLIISGGGFDEMFEHLANVLRELASTLCIRFGLGSTEEILQTSKRKKVKLPMKTSRRVNQVAGKVSQNCGIGSDDKDFIIAGSASWQVKYLLTTESTRTSALNSPFSGTIFSALSVISELCIQQCLQLNHLEIEPIVAYTTFAIFMSLQNTSENADGIKDNDLHQASSSLEVTFDGALNHIINCVDRLYLDSVSGKPRQEVERAQSQKSKCIEVPEGTSNPTEGYQSFHVKRIQILVKLYTAVMKFVVDAVRTRLPNQTLQRCLKFASDHIHHIVSALRGHKYQKLSNKDEVTMNNIQEEVLKDISIHLKSSFSYAAKLLHEFLKNTNEGSGASPEAFHLANDLLDLIASTGSSLGSRHDSNIVSIAKPWLPTIILGLGCNHLMMPDKECTLNLADLLSANFPIWLSDLGDTEFHIESQTPKSKSSAFESLIELMLVLLKKGSHRILDATCGVILGAVEVMLKNANFSLVLGLIRFVCFKMFENKSVPSERLQVTNSYLRKVYQLIAKELEEHQEGEDERHHLVSALKFIESIL
ncbi:uncharacterized protein LOC122016469 [Zingiber officinale]|uniref:Condensin-2 complex subunit G2 n=1 Tax=Zingiber officinale TaxID=94328 RepID=A0A8J5F6P2_ZINOF|nr:uncharacterized protein LOC122016469 [Zingiber officinale]KAG6482096.1 hypothetical protein ZIOFF_058724 [Zingiber officinale]